MICRLFELGERINTYIKLPFTEYVVFLGWCTLGAHGAAGTDVVAGVHGTHGTDVVAGVYGAARATARQLNRTACGPTRFFSPRAGHKRGGVA